MADLLVLDRNATNRIRVLAYDGKEWRWQLERKLPADVQFVDALRSKDRDRLLISRRGQIDALDMVDGTVKTLITGPSTPLPPGANRPLHIEVTRDLNGDSLDDLVIPTEAGVWVTLQNDDGTFRSPFKVAQPFAASRFRFSHGYRFEPWELTRLHQFDYDQDGNDDLAYWNGKEFVVHDLSSAQDFGKVIGRFHVATPFDSDDITTLAAPYGVQHRERDRNPEGSMDSRVLHSIRDMDGDQHPDLVFYSLRGGSIWDLVSVIEIHYGETAPDGSLRFLTACGSRLKVAGIPFRLWLRDVDADRSVDIVLTTIKPSVIKVVSLLSQWVFTRRHSMDLQVFSMRERDYPSHAMSRQTIKVSSGNDGMVFPTLLFGDFRGDSLEELLVGLGKSLRLHCHEPGRRPFAGGVKKLRIPSPREEFSWADDLNRDGKPDVLLHDVRSDESDRMIVLMRP